MKKRKEQKVVATYHAKDRLKERGDGTFRFSSGFLKTVMMCGMRKEDFDSFPRLQKFLIWHEKLNNNTPIVYQGNLFIFDEDAKVLITFYPLKPCYLNGVDRFHRP